MEGSADLETLQQTLRDRLKQATAKKMALEEGRPAPSNSYGAWHYARAQADTYGEVLALITGLIQKNSV